MYLWNEQQTRYLHYWHWYSGKALAEKIPVDGAKEDIYKFPLQINTVRDVARKHAAVLIGEEPFDSPRAPISMIAKARARLGGKKPNKDKSKKSKKKGGGAKQSLAEEIDDDDRYQADLAQAVVNEIWIDSHGRATQPEAATISQFLGGSVWQIIWDTSKFKTHRFPITIKPVVPDYFLPIYDPNDPYNLIEVYVVYRITAAAANAEYGTDFTADHLPIYCEHWTKTTYSAYIDGRPIEKIMPGVQKDGATVYKALKNEFGFVPFVYIPHWRDTGSFYGSSCVPDFEGLLREYNARQANIGDIVRNTAQRRRYVRNVASGQVKEVVIGRNLRVYDLGVDIASSKHEPDIIFEDPPTVPEGISGYPDKLWLQILRQAALSDIAYGEDEGSQRSALTLAFRMWPLTSHVRMERAFWTEGFVVIAQMVINMLLIKRESAKGNAELEKMFEAIKDLEDDVLKRVQFGVDWLPMIPRDREEQSSEIMLRFQSGLLSPETALELYGDIPYILEELERIKDYAQFQASLAAAGAGPDKKNGTKQGGEGAPTDVKTPAVGDGLSGDE